MRLAFAVTVATTLALAFALIGFEPGDGAIIYPVVRHTAQGYFLRWNPGAELATGVSSPLFVVILVPVYWTATLLSRVTTAFGDAESVFPVLVKLLNLSFTIALLAAIGRIVSTRFNAPAGGAAATLVLGSELALIQAGMAGFETPFYFLLIAAAFNQTLLTVDAAREGRIDAHRRWRLGVWFALLLLTRIESAAFVAAFLLALADADRVRQKAAWTLVATAMIAITPALLWSLYCWRETGFWIPTSALVRRNQVLQLQLEAENGSWWWIGPYAAYLVVIASGIASGIRSRAANDRALAIIGVVCLVAWTFHFLWIFPVGAVDGPGAARHLLVIALLSVFFLPGFLNQLRRPVRASGAAVGALVAGLLVVNADALVASRRAVVESALLAYRVPQPQLFMMQPELSSWLNRETPPDAVVLLFEIEARYLIQRRVLDMEGYMGGLALPYVNVKGGGDFAAFLRRYRPSYWVLDRSITEMPMFAGTIYNRVREACEHPDLTLAAEGCRYEEHDIRFTLVKRPPPDQVSRPELWEYRGVFHVEYLDRVPR